MLAICLQLAVCL